jgi:hypothetical protein
MRSSSGRPSGVITGQEGDDACKVTIQFTLTMTELFTPESWEESYSLSLRAPIKQKQERIRSLSRDMTSSPFLLLFSVPADGLQSSQSFETKTALW